MSQKLIQLLRHFMAALLICDPRTDVSSVNLAQAGSFAARNLDGGTKRFDDLTPLVRANERRGRSRCERTVVSSSLMEEMQNADYFLFCVCVQEKRNEESSWWWKKFF